MKHDSFVSKSIGDKNYVIFVCLNLKDKRKLETNRIHCILMLLEHLGKHEVALRVSVSRHAISNDYAVKGLSSAPQPASKLSGVHLWHTKVRH